MVSCKNSTIIQGQKPTKDRKDTTFAGKNLRGIFEISSSSRARQSAVGRIVIRAFFFACTFDSEQIFPHFDKNNNP
jgi:hypothetical protein